MTRALSIAPWQGSALTLEGDSRNPWQVVKLQVYPAPGGGADALGLSPGGLPATVSLDPTPSVAAAPVEGPVPSASLLAEIVAAVRNAGEAISDFAREHGRRLAAAAADSASSALPKRGGPDGKRRTRAVAMARRGGRRPGARARALTTGRNRRGSSPRGVRGWIDQAIDILARRGVPKSKLDPGAIATIIKHESGGNPRATNNWDSNAARGTPSKGLMQTIDPTFNQYKLKGHGDVWNPVDNIIAGVRYALARYGSLAKVPGVAALARGGRYQGY